MGAETTKNKNELTIGESQGDEIILDDNFAEDGDIILTDDFTAYNGAGNPYEEIKLASPELLKTLESVDVSMDDEDFSPETTTDSQKQDSFSPEEHKYSFSPESPKEEKDGIDLLLQEIANSDQVFTENVNLDDDFNILDDEDEDYANEIIDSLKSKGFEGLDDLQFDALEVLESRSDIFDDSGKTVSSQMDLVCSKVISNFNDFCVNLNSSVAVNVKREDNSKQLTDFMHGDKNSGLLLKRIESFVSANYQDEVDKISKLGKRFSEEQIDVIVTNAYNALRRDPILEELIDNDYYTFIQNVESTVNGLLNLQNTIAAQNKLNDTYRYNTSKYLLQDEIDMANYMKSDLTDNADGSKRFNICFIKQIFTNTEDYSFRCEKCGELVPIDGPVAVNISFPINGSVGKKSMLFPKVFTCKCGQKHYFAQQEINALTQFIKKDALTNLNELTKKLIDMSEGSAILKYQIPVNILGDVWSYLFVSKDVKPDEEPHENDPENDIFTIQVNSDAEYQEAVKAFYSLLNTFNANKIPKVVKLEEKEKEEISTASDFDFFNQDDFFSQVDDFYIEDDEEIETSFEEESTTSSKRSDLLTYKEIAIYFCKILSIDYNTVKNKALFSIVFSINNNHILRNYLNQSNIYKLNSVLKFIDSCETMLKKNHLPDDDQLVELVCIANFYGEAGTLDKLEKTKDDKVAYCRTLLEILISEKDVIKEELEYYQKVKDRIIKNLEASIDSLAFSQIINISQFEMEDVLEIINDSRLYDLFDVLTDRMIITNYAEDFYNKFVTFKIINTNTLKKSLVIGTHSSKITERIQNAISKYCENNAINVSSIALAECFQMTDALTPSNLNVLKDLNKAFTDADYYAFCNTVVEIADAPEKLNTLISEEYTEMLNDFIELAYPKAKKLIDTYDSDVSYYLQSFSQDEQSLAKVYKKHLHFSRYMPKPEEGETITDYLDRYERLLQENALTKYNSIDYGEGFDKFTDYFGLLFSCSALYETAYHSFSVATFVTQFVKALTMSNDEKIKIGKLLGLSEPVLNLIDFEITNQEENIDFSNVNILLKLLSGIYVTSVKNHVDELLTDVNSCIVKNNSNLITIINKYDTNSWLDHVINLDETTFTPFDDVPEIIDYDDAMFELYNYTGYESLERYAQ